MPADKERKQVGFRLYPEQLERLDFLKEALAKEAGEPVSRNDVVVALVNNEYERRNRKPVRQRPSVRKARRRSSASKTRGT